MANYSHDDIHSVAERFLREHLANAESQSKTVRTDGQSGEGTDAEAEPPEIEEPEFVILSRRSGNATSYFYGWKSQRPLFTYSQHLAQVLESAASEELVRKLRKAGVEAIVLPAPELRRGYS